MKGMRKYYEAFSLGLQSSMEYRFDFLLGLISVIFPLTIQIFLWTGIFSSSQSGIVYGYTYHQMLSYSVFAALISKLVSGGVEWEVVADIKNGGLSKYMVKPIGYLPYRISCFLGQKSINALLIFTIICILLLVLNIYFGFGIGFDHLFIFVISIILSLVINFLIYFSLAAIAFWIHEAWGVFVFMGVVVNIVSGGVFPLDIFGDTLNNIFRLLPFQYTIFFSTNVLNGRLTGQEMIHGLFIQTIWIGIMFGVTNIIWKLGMKKYIAVGG